MALYLHTSTLGLISSLFHWSLDIFLIHNSVVFMRYSGALGAARLAVIQCTVHMRLSVRAWCIHFSLLTRTSLLHRLRALQDVMSQPHINNKAGAAEWVDSSHLWRDSCHVCRAPSLMSFILCLPPSWQWLMTLSCRVLPRWHSHLSFLSSLRCLTRWRIKVGECSQKNYWCHMFSEGNKWKISDIGQHRERERNLGFPRRVSKCSYFAVSVPG